MRFECFIWLQFYMLNDQIVAHELMYHHLHPSPGAQHKRRRRRRRRRRAPRRNFTSLRAENVQDEILGGVPT